MKLDDFVVPEKDFQVSANMRIESESLSGQTSATDSAHKGFKPKILRVALTIPFAEKEQLTLLIQHAESVEADGRQKVYTIVDETAEALNIQKVRFDDNFDVKKIEFLHAWRVTFVLVEYRSVPEKIEDRSTAQQTQAQRSDGQPIVASEGDTAALPELTGFEKVLKKFDDSLA